MFSSFFQKKPKPQPITTIELKSTPAPTELQSLLENIEIREIHQVGDKTCLISNEHIIVYDAKSKDAPKKYKIPPPGKCWNSFPWSDDFILLNCSISANLIFAFDISSGIFSGTFFKVTKQPYDIALGKLRWGNDNVLVVNGKHDRTQLFKANNLFKIEPILGMLEGGYDGHGKVSDDHCAFVMKSGEKLKIASFKNGECNISEITNKKLAADFICAARMGGYISTDGHQFKLLDDKFNITAVAKPATDTNRTGVVLPDQQQFLYLHYPPKDYLTLIKFKEKSNPKAKDELETTIFKFPGIVKCFAIDEKNARLMTYLKNADNTHSLHIFDNFQPIIEYKEKLSEAIALSMYGTRIYHTPKELVDIVTDYLLKPRL